MMEEKKDVNKKVDESWKNSVDKDKSSVDPAGQKEPEMQASFSLFISSLMMQAMSTLGEIENPLTKKKEFNKAHAKFIIDTLSMMQEKTKNNLTKEESEMLEGILYELRMRFVAKTKEGAK